MSIRKCGVLLALICACALVVPVAAGAKSTPSEAVTSFAAIPVHGQTASGKAFNGYFSVNHFTSQNGATYAVGHLTGFAGNRAINLHGVQIPIYDQPAPATTAAVCPILHLVLGPLNLNLLGLHVHLNKVVLNITAVSGPGNLLGNLLCSVANLLNGTGLTPAQTTGLYGLLQNLLGSPSLLSL